VKKSGIAVLGIAFAFLSDLGFFSLPSLRLKAFDLTRQKKK